jgi:hypothetical protein
MYNKVKKFGLNIKSKIKEFSLVTKAWLSNSNNREITTSIVAILVFIVAIATLIYTDAQVRIARSELEMARANLETARADLEARTRPYLSIESVLVEDRGEDWLSIMVGINNLGEMPATRVQLRRILMGGEQIAWTNGQPYEDYPGTTNTTEGGVTITAGGILIAPGRSDFPANMIFFPQKLNMVEVPAYGATWRATITEGSVMDIGLTYFWGDRQYEYVATAMLSEGEWKIILERGD